MFKALKRIIEGKGSSLTQRVMHSASWVLLFQIISHSLNFLKAVILARLLAPEDFGLVGIAFLAITLVDVFSYTGFFQALIQKKSDIKEYLNTAWSISIIRGMLLTAVLYFAAPLIGSFFNEARAVPVVKVLAFTVLINELANIGIVYFIKDLQYKKNYKIHLISDIISFIVSVYLAFELKNVWALVYGQITNKLFNVILSYIYHPYRPRFSIDKSKAAELFRFGKFLTASSMLQYFIQQGDKAVIGRLLDASALGIYSLAYRFSVLVSDPLNNLVISILFPAYSKIQDDLIKLKEYYLRALKFTSLISIPVFIGTLFLADELVELLLGSKWLPAVPVIRILAALGIFSVINALNNSICLSLGKPRISTYNLVIQLVFFGTLIIPFTIWLGLSGAALTLLLSNVIYSISTSFQIKKILKFRFMEVIKIFFPPILGSTFMVLILLVFKYFWITAIPVLLISVILGFIMYISSLFLSDKFLNFQILTDIKTILGKSV
jgi:lipopolysaccharide exporter